MNSTKKTIEITKEEAEQIIDALLFLGSSDICYDTDDQKYEEMVEDNLKKLEIAKVIADKTGANPNRTYLFDAFISESEDENCYIKQTFNIQVCNSTYGKNVRYQSLPPKTRPIKIKNKF